MEVVKRIKDEGRYLLAVPKKGRLQVETLDILGGSGLKFHREPRSDIALVDGTNIALIFLPAADIPTFVGEGTVDMGITGRDQVAEHDASLPDGEASNVEEYLDLEFGGCKLQVQAPVNSTYKKPEELVGRTVVTSFTAITEAYFRKLEGVAPGEKMSTHIKYVGGSVETACNLGVADGIVDLVESGTTMRLAGLGPIGTVLSTTAVLIKSRQADMARKDNFDVLEWLGARIRGYLAAKKHVLCQYNIPRAQLSKACVITPGKRAPTITALEEENWVAVSSMVVKKEIPRVMDELTEVGATDILVLDIINSRA